MKTVTITIQGEGGRVIDKRSVEPRDVDTAIASMLAEAVEPVTGFQGVYTDGDDPSNED